jgi:hypothetical protein
MEFVRLTADQRIVEVDQAEAQSMIQAGTAGVTATAGIVEFLKDWTHPGTGRSYIAGDLEKFADDPQQRALVEELKTAGIVRPLSR